MRILYACADNARDPAAWSGSVSGIARALSSAGVQVDFFDKIPFEVPLPLRLKHQIYKRLPARTHYLQVEPAILKRTADRIAERFTAGGYDAVFSPGSGVPVYAYLPKHIPFFAYLDATKESWIRDYVGWESLCSRSQRAVKSVDKESLTNARTTFFSSAWAMSEALGQSAVCSTKLACVPFGANLLAAPARAEVEVAIAARAGSVATELRLLFLGKEWARKGGPEALQLVSALREMGIPAVIDIVGCRPKLAKSEREFVRVHGFIDHSQPSGQVQLRELMSQAHWLVFLSRAEAYGIALCEAAAYGVPALASNVGGIPTIVRDGVSGYLAEQPFDVKAEAAKLAGSWRDRELYSKLALAARHEYETRLNWEVAGRSLRQHMERVLELGKK